MKTCSALIAGLFLSSSMTLPVKAQITVDGTTNTTLTPINTGIRIDDGDRAGNNLFHSFEQFSVLNGSEAFFNNANDIVNIFSRVTGGSLSNIDGLLRANGTANLFLLNPAGIIFGENAQLDIGGSFLSSTADSIVFSDGVEFLATNSDEPPLLTINMPIGLNLGNNPGAIVNRSVANNGRGLEVAIGEAITLVGGNINLERGRLFAPGGRVELGGLSAAGEVGINADGSLVFPEGVARADVTLTNGARVNVRAGGRGNIGVNAGNLELSGGESGISFLLAGIAANSGSTEAQAGDIILNATDLITLSEGSTIANQISRTGEGNSGGINITTNNLSLTQGSQINTGTFGQGDGGTITIKAFDTILVEGETQVGIPSSISSQVNSTGVGMAGEINLTTSNLSLIQGGRITALTLGQGDAGMITIKAFDTVLADGATQTEIPNVGILPSGIGSVVVPGAIGDAGKINITTTNLFLTGGAQVGASTAGQGDAGAINIKADGTILLDGENREGSDSGIFSQIGPDAIGDSGGINITTTNLSLTRGGEIAADTFGQGNAGAIIINALGTISAEGESLNGSRSGIVSLVISGATGNSGGINITTNNLSLTQGGRVSASTLGQGDAGAIIINALGTISVEGESQNGFNSSISSQVNSTGVGKSKGINITTTNLSLKQGGRVSASTLGQGSAGEINIKADETISADGATPEGNNSGIFSRVEVTGEGNANNININTNNLFLTNESEISVESLGQGEAKDLFIKANSLNLANGASLLASTPEGRGGRITLKISEGLTLRDNSIISAQALGDADGGNININSDLIVAFPNQNNDIIASASQGNGGEINITTRGIFGIEERSSTPDNETNDIDASSQFGLDGTININLLDTNPAEGIEDIPRFVIDPDKLVVFSLCSLARDSEFYFTAKGGNTPDPVEVRDEGVIAVDLVEPVPFGEEENVSAFHETPLQKLEETEEVEKEIVEAQGWIFHENGVIELVAYKTDPNGAPPQPKDPRVCPK